MDMVNLGNCIKTSYGIGHDTVYNICAATQTTVPWGAATWVGQAISFTIFVGLAYFFVSAYMNAKKMIDVKITKTTKK